MSCIHLGNAILNMGGPTVVLGNFQFEMHSYMGPIKLNKNGEVSKTDFPASFWPLFQRWTENGRKVNSNGKGLIE